MAFWRAKKERKTSNQRGKVIASGERKKKARLARKVTRNVGCFNEKKRRNYSIIL